jgi:hypothetical protein
MDAHFSQAHLELARVYEHREMYDAALEEFAKARALSSKALRALPLWPIVTPFRAQPLRRKSCCVS